ncbi:unnamed protein product [Arabidopsis thaliana]|uniref:Cellulose synthase n=1 Tax=Arabidopsis thaliana TaxID=3702 RepID=A0A7G2EA15_ARATH|nr:unnamed protein product [Arabidopsis thaliana]
MNTGGRLIAGSHNRNEFVLINADDTARIRSAEELSGQTCKICRDEIELTDNGEPFIACNECAFPTCRPCYEYERREGNQACPQCGTRYKRIKGSPRVEGDEEDDDIDDLEHEFYGMDPEHVTEAALYDMRLNTGRGTDEVSHLYSASPGSEVPLLTYCDEDSDMYSDRHALIVPPSTGLGNRVHHVPFTDSFASIHTRPMVPQKDLTVYGYGSVAWKDRMEVWKKQQIEKLQVVKNERVNDGDGDGFIVDELDDPGLPMMDEGRQPLSRKLPIRSSRINPYRMLIFCRLAILGLFFHYRILHPKMDYLKHKVDPAFVMERRAMKRDYEEFKVKINALVSVAQKVPEDGWTMQDGTPWPGNNVRDHPGMIQVFLGHSGVCDMDGNELPRLVYVSREKRPGFDHHKKAGAMNSLIRVSAVLSNAPYLLNVDCDHYINNSKAIREAMCFMMDPQSGKKICYVQFPQRFDGIDRHDRYSNRNVVFFDINMKGLDGIQGPIYVGTGCVFRRQALYGFDAPKKKKPPGRTCNCWPKWCCLCCGMRKKKTGKVKDNQRKKPKETSKQIHALEHIEEGLQVTNAENNSETAQLKLEKKFGQSPVLVASTLLLNGGVPSNVNPASLLRESIQVISCGYEEKTEWGKEIGWIYGSVTEDILTGFKMHCHGWRSVYCMPKRAAFKGSAPINLSDRLHQVLRWALGSVEIFLSRHCPIWYGYGGGLKWLERFSYINSVVYPWTSLPLLVYCSLPAICLLTGKFIVPEISNYAGILFLLMFMSIAVTGILEMQWGKIGIDDWWRNEQFWVIGGVSSHLFALFQGLLKVLAGVSTNFTVTSKAADDGEFSELYIFKWTSLLIPPTTLLIINIVGVIVGVSDAINNGYDSWGPLFGRLFFALWVIVHLYPFLKGLLGKQDRVPTIILVWSILLASILTLLWVRVNPFVSKDGPVLEICGLDCLK